MGIPRVNSLTPRPIAGNPPQTQPENRIHYPALDGLRAVALGMVFGSHYAGLPWGNTGVDLFFALSGFLITGILFDSIDRPDRIRTFYIRRALRIFPLYYGIFLVLLALTPILQVQWNRYWIAWPLYLGNLLRFTHAYTTNPDIISACNGWLTLGRFHEFLALGHFWSLCTEEQFYVVWPWVVFAVKDRRKLLWICAVAVLVWPLLRILAVAYLPPRYITLEITYGFTPFRVDSLLIGALLALLIRGQHRQTVLRVCRWMAYFGLTCFVIYFICTVHLGQPYAYPAARFTWGQSLIGLLSVAIIGTALLPETLLYRFLGMRPLRKLGQISYGAYLFHDMPHNLYMAFVGHLAHRNAWIERDRHTAQMLLAITTTLLFASCSYRFFERPILNLKERFAPSR